MHEPAGDALGRRRASRKKQAALPRTKVSKLMERHGHDPVGRVEGLLDSVAVVDVDVDVEDASVKFQQLQNAQHDVVHVAET